jgi:hypothetical protein
MGAEEEKGNLYDLQICGDPELPFPPVSQPSV